MWKRAAAYLMILLLVLKPAAVWAAEDQKQEETEVPEESRTQEDRELNQVAAEVSAPHALLMEVSTGTVLMEKAADEKVPPASVTKIMTLLLILEALEDGKIALSDMVTVSEHAASMGGSQVYLEPYEKQTVETLLKCIAVASANDACVAYRLGRQRQISLQNVHFSKNKIWR